MAQIGNRRRLNNPVLQRIPENQQMWRFYQQELHKIDSGSFVPTFTGFSSDPSSPVVYWVREGSFITLKFDFTTGTSNATTWTITNFPGELAAQEAKEVMIGGLVDNGSNSAEVGWVIIPAEGGTTLTFGLGADNPGGGGFTAASTKGFQLANGTHCMYSVYTK